MFPLDACFSFRLVCLVRVKRRGASKVTRFQEKKSVRGDGETTVKQRLNLALRPRCAAWSPSDRVLVPFAR